MSGPPQDVEAADLWRKLSEFPCPSDIVDFPRKDGNGDPIQKVRIQVLRTEQHDEARHRAHKYMTDERGFAIGDLKSEIPEAISGDACAIEVLALACVGVNPIAGTEDKPKYPRLFPDGRALRTMLSADEVAALFKMYLMVQRKFGPTERTVENDDDLNAWVRTLVKGASAYPLGLLDLPQLADLTCSLAQRVFTLSLILDSLLPTLPESLALSLTKLGIGTGFFGGLQEITSDPNSLESSEEGPILDVEPGELATEAEALKVAKKIRGKK